MKNINVSPPKSKHARVLRELDQNTLVNKTAHAEAWLKKPFSKKLGFTDEEMKENHIMDVEMDKKV